MTTSFFNRVREKIVAFGGTFAASLSPRTRCDVRLVDEQLAIARFSSRYYVFALPAGAILIALMCVHALPLWRLIAWPAAVTLACAGFEVWYRWLARPADHAPGRVRMRARLHTLMTFAITAVWCSMTVLIVTPDAHGTTALVWVVLACTLAGWSSMGATHFAAGAAAMPLYLVAMCLLPDVTNSAAAIGICVIYWAMMAHLFGSNYVTRERMMRLEIERGPLIDDLKRAKEESDRARHRAETASQAKSAFLANMSHELRTPLNAILGFSEIIHTRAFGPDAMGQYSEYGGYIHTSGHHLLALINDILDLAKIEAGRFTLHETEVDLSRLMDESVLMIQPRAHDAGVSVRIEIDQNCPNIHGDERALRQIFANLLSNAVKFTPKMGSVTLFANCAQDGMLLLGVADTGVGIAPEDHARVFESFGQGRHDVIREDHGTGLGLPIVKGLAQAHGGHVRLDSAPGRGTRVTVILPNARIRVKRRAA